MAESICCVLNCGSRSHDPRGRSIPTGLSFHCFPCWRKQEGQHVSRLTGSRRAGWVAAVGRRDISFYGLLTAFTVCSRHFHSGKPCGETLEADPDWVPSLHMGHSEGSSPHNQNLLQSEQRDQNLDQNQDQDQDQNLDQDLDQNQDMDQDQNLDQDLDQNQDMDQDQNLDQDLDQKLRRTAGGPDPLVRSWTEVRPLLLSALRREPVFSETHGPAEKKKKNLDFRDFFRAALEAALEGSSGSRTPSAPRDSTGPHRRKTCEEPCSSSSCGNCEHLLRRCMELQETLCRLQGGQEDFTQSLQHQDQDMDQDQNQQSPEKAHDPSSVESLAALNDGDLDSAKKRTQEDPEDREDQEVQEDPEVQEYQEYQEDPVSSSEPHPNSRFQKIWLKMFWFLRYSPTLDQMWCHVCRLYAEKSQHKNSMIKGSRLFRVRTIKKHSASNYHQDNEVRHMYQTYNLLDVDCEGSDASSSSSPSL